MRITKRLVSKKHRLFFGGFFIIWNEQFVDMLASGHHIGIVWPQRIKDSGLRLKSLEWRKIKTREVL